MSEDGSSGRIRTSDLRHALRTPLHHIAGYSDMLLEDVAQAGARDGVKASLEAIRETGREILEILERRLPGDRCEIGRDELDAIGDQLDGLIADLSKRVNNLASRTALDDSGVNLPDVLRIGIAVEDLANLLSGKSPLVSSGPVARLAPSDDPARASGRILIVDDNPVNRDLLSRMLERYGLETAAESSGEAGLARVATEKFDLILLDLMMPGMDGIEVLRHLKGDSATADTSVIMLSALDETARVTQCLELGAEDYVVKPFDPVLMLARLRSTLERNRLRTVEAVRSRELEAAYTQLRENGRRLQDSEERLRLATEAGEVGIWYLYPETGVMTMTPVCRRLFGVESEQEILPAAQMSATIHPEDRARADEQLLRAFYSRGEYNIEYRVAWPDGSVHWLNSRGVAGLVTGSGERRMAGIAIDVSERRKAEDAVRQAGKLESIGLLAGGIAHDFNNLLTGIIGSATFVLENDRRSATSSEMLRNIIDAGERAANLTQQLLAYSGKGKFTLQKLNLTRIASDLSMLLRVLIPKEVAIEKELHDDLPSIDGDVAQIQQVLMNLVINGSEAIEGEGTVWVRTGVVELGEGDREDIVVGDKVAPGEYVYLEVQDNGSGMDRAMLAKIFDPFFTTKFSGRGLGLAAVFGIVRGHDGAMRVRTAIGKGSTFRIYFPPAKSK